MTPLEDCYILLGLTSTNTTKLLNLWEKSPTQDQLDAAIANDKGNYMQFILMKDILFIEGSQSKSKPPTNMWV